MTPPNSTEVKPCPFCGELPQDVGKINIFSKTMYRHPFPVSTEHKKVISCILAGNHGYWTAEQWNQRTGDPNAK